MFAVYYPFLNVAFLASFAITLGLGLLIIPIGKRRPVGAPLTWGEAMLAATYVFAVLFLAYGVVPHQWLNHADNELNWRSDKLVYGPGGIVESYSPFSVTYVVVRDLIVVGIYAFFLGMQLYLWSWWQKRGKAKPSAAAALPTSTFGRPLVRKG